MALGTSALILPVNAADETTRTKTRHRNRTSDYSAENSGMPEKALGHLDRANKLIGKEVLSSDDQKVGKIDNVVVDLESGHVLYAVIGSGGFLGAGEKKFAVTPRAFATSGADNLTLKVDKAKLAGAPEFSKDVDKDEQLGKRDFVANVYQYFGERAWWQGKTARKEVDFHNVHKTSDLIGMKVKNSADQDLGKIDNVMLNLPEGRIAYVILSPDSSLKLGNNLYALPPDALTLSTNRKTLNTGLNQEKLAAAPHFDKNNWQNVNDPSWASQVYQYYGKEAWFSPRLSRESLQPTGRTNAQGEVVAPK